MGNIIEIIKNKLKEKNVEIYKEGMCEDEYNIVCADMILFIKEKEVSVAFQATTRPEDAASYVLLLSETKFKVIVMESFIIDSQMNMLTGDDAYELIKSSEYELLVKEATKNTVMTELLLKANCYNC